MSAFEQWEIQRELLKTSLKEQHDMAGVTYAVRHALSQTEQNTLAELEDDVLRQQMGVLFGELKTSVGLLEASVMSKVWVPQSQKVKKSGKGKLALWTIAALLQLACGLICYFKGLWPGWLLALAALITSAVALISGRTKAAPAPQMDEVRVTLSPDVDRLLSILDGQVRSLDRCMNDFIYLNDQLRGGVKGTDPITLSRVSEVLEALYECDEQTRAPAEEALEQMLEGMGLKALSYNEESSRLFTALPSKTETRTLSPAIVSAQDYRLLRRGTAAVKTDVA